MPDVLLPSSASAQEIALEQATARIGDVPVRVRDVWNADTCPEGLLPWLAWHYSVDEWDTGWTVEQRRAAIKDAVRVHRHKGTIGAVRESLQALGYGVQVQEWHQQIPVGAPYTFKLLLESNQVGIDQTALAKILRVVYASKNLRSHPNEIAPCAVTRAGPRVAVVASMGLELTIKFGGGDLISDGYALSDGNEQSNGIKQ